jgi:putative (di)nucleoside polyphosphate hydrolase
MPKEQPQMARIERDLPYRACVGIMLLNRDSLVWIGRRCDKANDEGPGQWWQMPQGGIDEAEDPAAAALRELEEETSARSAEIISETPGWLIYDLPDHLIGKAWKGRYRGQKQKWFAARFLGDDSEFNLAPEGQTPEFDAWRWAPMEELAHLVVPFKRDVYEQVIAAFRHLAP